MTLLQVLLSPAAGLAFRLRGFLLFGWAVLGTSRLMPALLSTPRLDLVATAFWTFRTLAICAEVACRITDFGDRVGDDWAELV